MEIKKQLHTKNSNTAYNIFYDKKQIKKKFLAIKLVSFILIFSLLQPSEKAWEFRQCNSNSLFFVGYSDSVKEQF